MGSRIGHHAALRQLANRLVGILHGCLATGTTYTEDTPGLTTAIKPDPQQLATPTPWDV